MPNSFKIRLKNLSFIKKIILIGSFLMVVSVFMPWYSDVDKFKIGESFLGISGPMYLAGFFVLISGGISLVIVIFYLMGKKLPKLPLQEIQIHILGSILALLMLILTASVYFHPKFGVNLTDKTVGIGMILEFIGSGLVFLGGILSLRAKEINFEVEGKIEPLIKIEPMERQQNNLELKKNITVGEAIKIHESVKKTPSGWGQVQESINNIKDEKHV